MTNDKMPDAIMVTDMWERPTSIDDPVPMQLGENGPEPVPTTIYIRADLCPKPEKIEGLKEALKNPLAYSAKADCLKVREEVTDAARAYLKLTEG
jgi:hypothetical protein